MSKRAAKKTSTASTAASRSRGKKKKGIDSTAVLIVVAAALVVVIAVIAIGVGCNGKKEGTANTTKSSDDLNVEVETNEEGETVDSANTAVEVARQDLVNTDQIQIEITGIDANNTAGFTINLDIKNKSDVAYVVAAKYAIVEGLNIDPKWSSEVAGGQTKESSITFYKSDYAAYGIGFTDIQLILSVVESSDTASQILQQAVRIYPYGQGAAKLYTRTTGKTDVVLADNDAYRMTFIGFEKDDVWGYTAKVYIENKSTTNLWIAASDVTVNGKELDPYFGIAAPASSATYASICWTNEQLSEASIEEITEIAMHMRATNYDDWEAAAIAEDDITIRPES